MTSWILVRIYFEFPCQFWQSFTSFRGNYEDFVGTPQNCKNQEIFNIFNFSAFDYYMNQMSSQWWWHYDVILWRHKCSKLSRFQNHQNFAIINAILDSYCSFCLFSSYIKHFVVLFHWFIDFWIGFSWNISWSKFWETKVLAKFCYLNLYPSFWFLLFQSFILQTNVYN